VSAVSCDYFSRSILAPTSFNSFPQYTARPRCRCRNNVVIMHPSNVYAVVLFITIIIIIIITTTSTSAMTDVRQRSVHDAGGCCRATLRKTASVAGGNRLAAAAARPISGVHGAPAGTAVPPDQLHHIDYTSKSTTSSSTSYFPIVVVIASDHFGGRVVQSVGCVCPGLLLDGNFQSK